MGFANVILEVRMVVILLAGPNRIVDLILKSLALRLFEVIISDDCGSLYSIFSTSIFYFRSETASHGVSYSSFFDWCITSFLILLFLTGAWSNSNALVGLSICSTMSEGTSVMSFIKWSGKNFFCCIDSIVRGSDLAKISFPESYIKLRTLQPISDTPDGRNFTGPLVRNKCHTYFWPMGQFLITYHGDKWLRIWCDVCGLLDQLSILVQFTELNKVSSFISWGNCHHITVYIS